jgi:hypothetical protein
MLVPKKKKGYEAEEIKQTNTNDGKEQHLHLNVFALGVKTALQDGFKLKCGKDIEDNSVKMFTTSQVPWLTL